MLVTVYGANLAGMAVAARLARLGHDVELVTLGAPVGGRWAPFEHPEFGYVVDEMPQVITLPAVWRDLFKKSGGHLVAELNRAHLAFQPAPPVKHLFRDGTSLVLPSEPGGQFNTIRDRFGDKLAARWRQLMVDMVGVWKAYRAHALEGTEPVTTKAQRRALWLDRSLADIALPLGRHLGSVITDHAAPDSPGILALNLHVEQLFGRWQLVDAEGSCLRPSVLIELLVTRLQERGVRIVEHSDAPPDVDCRPQLPKRSRWRATPGAAPAPTVSHERFRDGRHNPHGIQEVVDHTAPNPVVRWTRGTPDGVLATTHDHTRPRFDVTWGVAATSGRDWLARIPIVGGDGNIRASTCSPAGAEPWAELSSAALAAYEFHERITGEDSRPTNKDFKPPRLRR